MEAFKLNEIHRSLLAAHGSNYGYITSETGHHTESYRWLPGTPVLWFCEPEKQSDDSCYPTVILPDGHIITLWEDEVRVCTRAYFEQRLPAVLSPRSPFQKFNAPPQSGGASAETTENRIRYSIVCEEFATEVERRKAEGFEPPCDEELRWYDEVAPPQSLCRCESDEFCLQVMRADEFNSRRGDDQREWIIPDWVRKVAAEVEEACPATIHYPSLLAEEWFGRDARTSLDDDRREEDDRLMEDGLAARSAFDVVEASAEQDAIRALRDAEEIAAFAEERRAQLIAAIEKFGGDPRAPATIAWVQSRVERSRLKVERDTNWKPAGSMPVTPTVKLRAYVACLHDLMARFTS